MYTKNQHKITRFRNSKLRENWFGFWTHGFVLFFYISTLREHALKDLLIAFKMFYLENIGHSIFRIQNYT